VDGEAELLLAQVGRQHVDDAPQVQRLHRQGVPGRSRRPIQDAVHDPEPAGAERTLGRKGARGLGQRKPCRPRDDAGIARQDGAAGEALHPGLRIHAADGGDQVAGQELRERPVESEQALDVDVLGPERRGGVHVSAGPDRIGRALPAARGQAREERSAGVGAAPEAGVALEELVDRRPRAHIAIP
jgi:hypothetical protein